MKTDHINRDKLDNRRENLQIVTAEVNARNHSGKRHNTSGVNGVSWQSPIHVVHGKAHPRWKDGQGRWRVHIWKNNRQLFVGYFLDLEQAKAARIAAEIEHWGITREELGRRSSERASWRSTGGVAARDGEEVARSLPSVGPQVARA